MRLAIILNLAVVSLGFALAAPGCYSSGNDNDDEQAGSGGSGGAGGAVGGPCTVPADCTSPLVCAPDLGRCVQCVDERHCSGDDECVNNRCVSPGNGGAPSTGGAASSGGSDAGGAGPGAGGNPGGAGGEPGSGEGGAGGEPGSEACGGLIDDLEDGDGTVCLGDGRQGQWFTWVGTGTIYPPASTGFPATLLGVARGSSQYAMNFTGTATTAAGIGVPFNSPYADFNNVYDGSLYSGITFFARADTTISASVEIRTYSVELTTYGGGCSIGCVSNSYGPITLGTDWQLYTIPFASMTGGSAPFSATELLNMQLIVSGSFNLWIDDPVFY